MVQVLSVGLLDGLVVVQPPNDGRRRVGDGDGGDHEGHRQHDDRGRAHDAHERDDADHGAQKQRARVPHEDTRRREVVAQKRQRRAQQNDGQHRRLFQTAPEGDEKQEERRDGRDARRQAVQAVDEVDDVHEAHEVQHRERIGPPAELDEPGAQRVRDARQQKPRGRDDGRPQNLPGELHAGLQRVHVVHGAHAHDGEQPAHHTGMVDGPIGAVDVEPGPAEEVLSGHLHDERRRDARCHGDAAHARRGLLVDAPGARVIDSIQTQGEPPCQRDAQIRHDEGKEAQHQEMSQSYSHAARMRPRTRGRGATR